MFRMVKRSKVAYEIFNQQQERYKSGQGDEWIDSVRILMDTFLE